MFELTINDGSKILAEYKEGLGWYDMQGWELNEEYIIWYEKI